MAFISIKGRGEGDGCKGMWLIARQSFQLKKEREPYQTTRLSGAS
jgi:hypothetical protein